MRCGASEDPRWMGRLDGLSRLSSRTTKLGFGQTVGIGGAEARVFVGVGWRAGVDVM